MADTKEAQAHRKRAQGKPLNPSPRLGLRALAKTCPKCGRLNTCPDQYLRIANKAMYSYCKPCERAAHRARQSKDSYLACRRSRYDEREKNRAVKHAQDTNRVSQQRAHKHRYVWTTAELEVAARSDLSAREVADALGRTVYAVQNMRRKLAVDPRKSRLADLPGETSSQADPGVINVRHAHAR